MSSLLNKLLTNVNEAADSGLPTDAKNYAEAAAAVAQTLMIVRQMDIDANNPLAQSPYTPPSVKS